MRLIQMLAPIAALAVSVSAQETPVTSPSAVTKVTTVVTTDYTTFCPVSSSPFLGQAKKANHVPGAYHVHPQERDLHGHLVADSYHHQ